MIRLLSTLFVTVLLTSPAYAQHPQSTLDKIKTTKTISLGYRESSFPFSYIGEDKKPAGYSVDLCTRIAAGVQQQPMARSTSNVARPPIPSPVKSRWISVT